MNKDKIQKMKPDFVDKLPDLDYAVVCLQGSRMLGMAMSEDADYDYRGVYVAKNRDLLAFHGKPKETIEGGSYGDDEIEWVFHEVEKFMRLAVKSNPSVVHLFFVPEYNLLSDVGRLLIDSKDLFLSEPLVRAAFGGYAMSQMVYLKNNRGNAKRREKHVRHCFRLFDSGKELLETGHMTLPLYNAEYYIELGKKINEEGGFEELYKLFEEKDREFQAVKSTLPEQPDLEAVNKLLIKIRGYES